MEIYGMMGERLGVIGQSPEPLPAWKRDFLSKPSASIRRGIAWGDQPPYEDTSTLVLTAPSGGFVDVRFPKHSQNPAEAASHVSFWAFSGSSVTSFHDASPSQPDAVDLPYTAHCKFLHDIDTRGPGITDQGDMCLLPNGDCLEFGQMMNPLSGKEEPYKEYWRSAEPLPTSDGTDDSKLCIAAHVAGPANVEGIIIRIGGRIQGITSRRHENGTHTIEVERWVREPAPTAKPTEEVNGWFRDVRSSGRMPCAWLCGPIDGLGQTLDFNGLLWNITELQR